MNTFLILYLLGQIPLQQISRHATERYIYVLLCLFWHSAVILVAMLLIVLTCSGSLFDCFLYSCRCSRFDYGFFRFDLSVLWPPLETFTMNE